jgi:CubicO group peptidase (beta-lactamase class C family)
VRIEGSVSQGYEAVVDALAECGAGVTVAAFVDGRLVVDAWSVDLSGESLVCTWSAIKPITGACLLVLVERGVIALDDPVVSVWPEVGDGRLLVRHLLTHTAGRVTVPDVALVDWERSVAALAQMEPDWAPGQVICEHAQTFGHLVGEVVRRVDGRSLGQVLSEELAGPLGLDVHIGVDDVDLGRVAETVGMDRAWWAAARGEPGSVRHRAMGPWVDVNERAWRHAEVPAVNGHATARGLASFWQAFLDRRLPAAVGEAAVTGHDRFLDEEVTWTLAGGRIDDLDVGMGGLGGQWAAARPSIGLAWAFLTTRIGAHDRAQRIEDQLVAAVRAGG